MKERKRRGPPPNPNSKARLGVIRRAKANRIVDDLDRRVGPLPPMFNRADIEAQVPADVTDPMLRKSVVLALLRRRGCVPLGAHRWGGNSYSLWAAVDSEALRRMTAGERARSLFGDPPPPPPPPQYTPVSVSDWKAEYLALHAALPHFEGKPWQVWRLPGGRGNG